MRYKFYFNLKKKSKKNCACGKSEIYSGLWKNRKHVSAYCELHQRQQKHQLKLNLHLFQVSRLVIIHLTRFFCCARDFLRILHNIIEKLVKLHQHTVTCIKGNSYSNISWNWICICFRCHECHHPWEFVRFKTICADFSPLNT